MDKAQYGAYWTESSESTLKVSLQMISGNADLKRIGVAPDVAMVLTVLDVPASALKGMF